MKVLFRADGNEGIGLGHLYRALAIATLIHERYETVLITRSVPAKLTQDFESYFAKIVELEECSLEDELLKVDKISSTKDIIIIDGYHFDYDYQIRVSQIVTNSVYVDDFCKGKYGTRAIINHSPTVSKKRYELLGYEGLLFLGLDFLMVRKEFLNQIGNKQSLKDSSILIALGGTDHKNQLTHVLVQIELIFEQVTVLTTSVNKNLKELKEKFANVRFVYDLPATGVIDVMQSNSLLLTSSSGLALEACVLKTKLYTCITAHNQSELYGFLTREKLCVGLGDVENLKIDKMDLRSSFIYQTPTYQSVWLNGNQKRSFLNLINRLSNE